MERNRRCTQDRKSDTARDSLEQWEYCSTTAAATAASKGRTDEETAVHPPRRYTVVRPQTADRRPQSAEVKEDSSDRKKEGDARKLKMVVKRALCGKSGKLFGWANDAPVPRYVLPTYRQIAASPFFHSRPPASPGQKEEAFSVWLLCLLRLLVLPLAQSLDACKSAAANN